MNRFARLLVLAPLAALPGLADGLMPPLTSLQVQQARKALAEFKASPKGPYFQIRWFCNDGSVHPPSPPPCASRGGGNQHADLSPAARRLAEWNLDVGVILTGLSFERFFDAARDHHLLKQLVLEKYLVEVDQGWIYRRARAYRGARQAEDEEKAGRKLLVQLLSNPSWLTRNWLLAGQVVAAVPHGAADAAVLKIRSLAKTIADADPRFQPIRAQIHSTPSPEDVKEVENFLAGRAAAESVQAQLQELARLLRQQYAGQILAVQLPAFRKKLAGSPVGDRLGELAAVIQDRNDQAAFSQGALLSFEIRRAASSSSDGRRNLDLADLNALLLEQAFRLSPNPGQTRRGLLSHLVDHFRYAFAAGLLSLRQFEALEAEIRLLERAPAPPSETYYQSVRYLARSAQWCRATVAKDFGPPARHYQAIEPAAAGLADHLLRGSAALRLSSRLDPLVADANRAAGIRHSIFGDSSGRGVVGVNPGVALGRLGIVEPGQEESAVIDPAGIYVIPETLADLKPMAGILTLDSGNALSHAQLLAANLGIPNATVPSSLLPVLAKQQGREVAFAVTPRGAVVLREKAVLSGNEQQIWTGQPAAARPRIDIDASRIRLDQTRIRRLTELGAADSGVIVGPKAANLAQLARYFPSQVAPALVLPFGIYQRHIDRAVGGGGNLRQEISDVFAQAERMRQSGSAPAEIQRFVYPKLAQFRRAIQTMPLLPSFEKELLERLRADFGPEGSYGVFVRSDTNAEDLPEFTGAGLNLTVPNQVGNRDILQAIKDVWASPFTERAYDWRSKILRSQDLVYPSVILMGAVPSDKSGVIATMNLDSGNTDEITVNVSEGVSAVVDGGVAESLLLAPDGGVRLLEQARCPYRRVVLAAGGVENRPASGDDHVLAPPEIAQLRRMVAEVKAKYPAASSEAGHVLPWDIEFGFEKGELRLFQIRPLVRSREARTLEALARLEAGPPPPSLVRLDERP